MSTQDKVALSVRERQQVAEIHRQLASADPRLARLLAGEPVPPQPRPAQFVDQVLRVAAELMARRWPGPLLLVVGLTATVAALSVSLVLSVVGALVLATGLGLFFCELAAHVADAAEQSVDGRRPQRQWRGAAWSK